MTLNFLNSYYYPWNIISIKLDNQGLSGVYLILNHITQDFYIGSAISKNDKSNRLYIRFRNHFLHSHKITNIHLHRAMLKYGVHNFSFHILEYTSITDTRKIETQYIENFQPIYNKLSFGSGTLNFKHTDETKKKMKNSYSQERREQIGSLNRNKTLSKETKILMSLAAKARYSSEEYSLKHKESMNKIKHLFSKQTGVYCSDTNKLIKVYPSAKDVARRYSIDYRTLRRHIKSGLEIKKFKIIVKYIL